MILFSSEIFVVLLLWLRHLLVTLLTAIVFNPILKFQANFLEMLKIYPIFTQWPHCIILYTEWPPILQQICHL